MKTIAFISSGHLSCDDRIHFHQAKSLSAKGFQTVIITSNEDYQVTDKNPSIYCLNKQSVSPKEKKIFFISSLEKFSPDCIVCSEPLPLLAAAKYKKIHSLSIKILYDVTEWYPSKQNLLTFSGIKKWLHFLKLACANYLACFYCHAFIFGEYYKSLPYRFLFPRKKFYLLPYFPDLKYVPHTPTREIDQEICLGYTGRINKDKGVIHLMKVAEFVAKQNGNKKIRLKIIGSFNTPEDKIDFDNLTAALPKNLALEIEEEKPFVDFCASLNQFDIFLDLREIDFENNYGLPIKLFYYLASGRPVIYSKLKAIKREMKNINFGYLVDPSDHSEIAKKITSYMQDSTHYKNHAYNAHNLAITEYNWGKIEDDFLTCIKANILSSVT